MLPRGCTFCNPLWGQALAPNRLALWEWLRRLLGHHLGYPQEHLPRPRSRGAGKHAPRKSGRHSTGSFSAGSSRRTKIVTAGTGRVRSYDLYGKLLWELKGMSVITIATPSAGKDLLYISSGYVLDALRPIDSVRPGGQGDISLKPGETANRYIAWCQKRAGPYHPSPLVYGGCVYVLYDQGFLACYDAGTGKEVYAKTRLDAGSDTFTASPVEADGKLSCISEDGETLVLPGAEV
jgi:outer membrane protein assembly factor BamB